jgi:hypothetical protein
MKTRHDSFQICRYSQWRESFAGKVWILTCSNMSSLINSEEG